MRFCLKRAFLLTVLLFSPLLARDATAAPEKLNIVIFLTEQRGREVDSKIH